MKVFIFGAGASYDYTNQAVRESARLPLAKDLFASSDELNVLIRDEFPAVRWIVEEVEERLAEGVNNQETTLNIEEFLDDLRSRSGNNNNVKNSLLQLRVFIKRLIERRTNAALQATFTRSNYSKLIAKVDQWQKDTGEMVIFVTFNYDTLLEDALGAIVYDWDIKHAQSLASYTAREDYKLIKPHGSVNWARVGFRVSNSTNLSDYINSDINKFDIRLENQPVSEHEFSIPALALPFKSKNEFECLPEHLEMLKSNISQVSDIVCIGWSGSEPHFVSYLAEQINRDTKLTVVTNSSTGGDFVLQNLEPWRISNRSRIDSGFSAFVLSEDLRNLLTV